MIVTKIPNYKASNDLKISTSCKTIDEVEKLLNNDCGYNFSFANDKQKEYMLTFDIDDSKNTDVTDFDIYNFIENLVDYCKQKYNFEIEEDDIYFTKNSSKNRSYHISVPKIIGNVEEQKDFAINYNKDNSFDLDLQIYSNIFFRAPNQSKDSKKGTEHKVIKGELKDFILYDISRCKYHLPQIVKPIKKELKNENMIHTQGNIKLICQLLNILPEKYFDNYETWSKIGFVIKNYEIKYNQDYSFIFHEFSKKSEKYKYSEVDKFYNNINKNENFDRITMTLGTIIFFAKEANISMYKQIMQKYYEENKIEITEKFLAQTIHEIAGDLFVYSENVFYAYSNSLRRWFKNGIDILKTFINDNLRDHVTELINSSQNDESYKSKLLNELKNYTTKNKNKQQIVDEYYQRYNRIENNIKFDEEPFLLGFNNGVYDLENNVFRNYTFEDYITLTTGYNYEVPNPEDIKIIENLISKIETDKDKLYLLKQIYSSGLINKSYQKFIVLNGCGANGKSLMNSFMYKALGNYFYKGDIKDLTSTKLSKGANTEIAQMNLKRYVSFSEPSSSSLLNNAIIKSLTGDSTTSARACYSNDTVTRLRSNLVLECNKRLLFQEELTHGDIRRYIDYEFTSRFTLNDEELDDKNKVFKAIIFSDQLIEEYKMAFMYILIKSAHRFITEDDEIYKIPKCVSDRTNDYIASNYLPYVFLTENYSKTNNANDIVRIHDIFDSFKVSDIYINLTKIERRKFTLQKFIEIFMMHPITRNYYKERHEHNNHETRNCLVNYTKNTIDSQNSLNFLGN